MKENFRLAASLLTHKEEGMLRSSHGDGYVTPYSMVDKY
jgi:hypothetical protein